MENLNLTVKVGAYRVTTLVLDWEGAVIGISLKNEGGDTFYHSITGPAALTLMATLNKLDLSTKSLHRRIMERLVADGVLAGAISGTPD